MALLTVRDLKTYYHTRKGYVRAVDGVNLNISRGKAVGLAGESGCGKSTTAYSIMRLLPPEGRIMGGEILFDGEDLVKKTESEMRKIRWRRISLVFQGAMNALNPVLTIGRQITDAIKVHKEVTNSQALDRAKELFGLVGLDPERINDYQHEFSGGMKQRAMIAMALECDPELIIADEPTTGLDVIVQSRILRLMKELQGKLDLSIMLITHNLSVIAEFCDSAIIMYAGKIAECSDIITLFKRPRHPYTYLLINGFPSIRGEKRRLREIHGKPPLLIDPPPGCRFHPRCPYTIEKCRHVEPAYIKMEEEHYVACHLAEKMEDILA